MKKQHTRSRIQTARLAGERAFPSVRVADQRHRYFVPLASLTQKCPAAAKSATPHSPERAVGGSSTNVATSGSPRTGSGQLPFRPFAVKRTATFPPEGRIPTVTVFSGPGVEVRSTYLKRVVPNLQPSRDASRRRTWHPRRSR